MRQDVDARHKAGLTKKRIVFAVCFSAKLSHRFVLPQVARVMEAAALHIRAGVGDLVNEADMLSVNYYFQFDITKRNPERGM